MVNQADWDQQHADAISTLRESKSFILLDLKEEGTKVIIGVETSNLPEAYYAASKLSDHLMGMMAEAIAEMCHVELGRGCIGCDAETPCEMVLIDKKYMIYVPACQVPDAD